MKKESILMKNVHRNSENFSLDLNDPIRKFSNMSELNEYNFNNNTETFLKDSTFESKIKNI